MTSQTIPVNIENFIFLQMLWNLEIIHSNKTNNKPKCRPDVVSHNAQPEEANHRADVSDTSSELAQPGQLQKFFLQQLNNRET